MAFTLHWPNTYGKRRPQDRVRDLKMYRTISMAIDKSNDRLLPLTQALSLQADVLFPNAEASVSNPSVAEDGSVVLTQPPGCVGNQLDQPFPLESRAPVALPLIMYPTETKGRDICSLPVINWETYILKVQQNTKRSTAYLREKS